MYFLEAGQGHFFLLVTMVVIGVEMTSAAEEFYPSVVGD